LLTSTATASQTAKREFTVATGSIFGSSASQGANRTFPKDFALFKHREGVDELYPSLIWERRAINSIASASEASNLTVHRWNAGTMGHPISLALYLDKPCDFSVFKHLRALDLRLSDLGAKMRAYFDPYFSVSFFVFFGILETSLEEFSYTAQTDDGKYGTLRDGAIDSGIREAMERYKVVALRTMSLAGHKLKHVPLATFLTKHKATLRQFAFEHCSFGGDASGDTGREPGNIPEPSCHGKKLRDMLCDAGMGAELQDGKHSIFFEHKC
jgi:hypothetical protein